MLKQLSPQDASFIYLETPATPMHIGSLALYDASQSPFGELTEKKIMTFFSQRLRAWPNARQRLVRVPMEADYPYWIEDRDFDVEYHIRRIGLPNPASVEELQTLAERIFARPLDLARPPWEIYVIEGLDKIPGLAPKSFALLTKTHHAAVDGASGFHLVQLLHDLQAQPADAPIPSDTTHTQPSSADPVPTDLELLLRTGFNNLRQPLRFAKVLAESTGMISSAVASLKDVERPSMQVVPKTRFNGRVSSHRVMRWINYPISEIGALRESVAGASINDVILTLCAGGLRNYLYAKNELNKRSLVSMAPINIRKEDDKGALGNQVSAMFVPIGTHIADPIERLASVRSATRSSKLLSSAVAAPMLTDYSQFVPAFTQALAARMMSSLAADGQPAFNLTITNVPGPQIPLYSMGSQMVKTLGIGPLSQGMGLIMPITSYCGEITIGFTSCRNMIPDPDFFADCIRESFAEFKTANAKHLATTQATADKPAPPKPGAKKAAPKKPARKKPVSKTAATKKAALKKAARKDTNTQSRSVE